MHELSLAENILETVAGHIPEGARLRSVSITAGPLSGVCADALALGLDVVAAQRNWETVTFTIARPEAYMACRECGTRYASRDFQTLCPKCGSFDRDIESGRECTIDNIEIEED